MKASKLLLFTSLPKNGMIYGNIAVLGKNEKDRDVMAFFQNRGTIRKRDNDARVRAVSRRCLQEALVAMFNAAAEPAIGSIMAMDNDGERFLHAVQERTEWAKDRQMNPRLFADLFDSLVAARQRWMDKPTAPHNIEEHCDLAKAIDRYHKEQAAWGRQLVRLFQEGPVAGETVEDEDEDGEEDEEEEVGVADDGNDGNDDDDDLLEIDWKRLRVF
ncbi:hypothetical protein E8E14_011324 [Neopestalotiopsis sp. 37M]|nr:hypothetical protein E8E14_011324 [Neopestalotiopsis sp. 37M]